MLKEDEIQNAIKICASTYKELPDVYPLIGISRYENDCYHTKLAHTLCVIVAAIKESTGKEPLLWVPGYNGHNGNEEEIKEWIRGESDKDLVTMTDCIGGFEACTIIDFTT